MRTRVKICGITRIDDALAAAQAGADAIGLVFDSKSPRYVTPDQAAKIARALPPFIASVGLFVNAAPDTIENVLNHVALDLIQFHGSEKPEQCRRYHRMYIKAIHMQSDIDPRESARLYSDAAGLLLDTYIPGVPGGTGQTFDWSRIPSGLAKPIILAGGLTAQNVAQAVQQARPYAVDVSSGVELTKGVKDAQKIAAFIEAVRKAA